MSERVIRAFVYMAFALIIFVCTLIVIRWTVDFVTWTEIDSGWAQTVGALIGLGIAIWLPHKQKIDVTAAEAEQRQDEERRVCMVFRDELRTLKKNFSGTNITRLLATPAGDIFPRRIALPTNRFPIFSAMIGRLTLVSDDKIRQGIIDAYEAANSLMEAGALNNDLLTRYKDLEHRNEYANDRFSNRELDFAMTGLEESCKQMRDMATLATSKVNEVLPLLDAILV